MKLSHLALAATVAAALSGGAVQAQQPTPNPGAAIAVTPPDTTVSTEVTTSTETTAPLASSATVHSAEVSVTTTTVTNGPVADTPENRAKYGEPMSRAGKRTAPKGN